MVKFTRIGLFQTSFNENYDSQDEYDISHTILSSLHKEAMSYIKKNIAYDAKIIALVSLDKELALCSFCYKRYLFFGLYDNGTIRFTADKFKKIPSLRLYRLESNTIRALKHPVILRNNPLYKNIWAAWEKTYPLLDKAVTIEQWHDNLGNKVCAPSNIDKYRDSINMIVETYEDENVTYSTKEDYDYEER